MVSRSGQDKWAKLLSTTSVEVDLGRILSSGDKEEVLEIPEVEDWSDWSELECDDSQMDMECRCSISEELESC